MEEINSLDSLWKKVEDINYTYFTENSLKPILGNGEQTEPKVMFVFINPTHVNISSSKDWMGPRFPFVGTKQMWRVFHRAGLFDDDLLERINRSKDWDIEFTNEVLNYLRNRSFYFTNIVKWTGKNATLPDSKKISLFLPILQKEIEIVKPEYVVAFGLIPFENLTGQKIKLSDYYEKSMKSNKLSCYETIFGSHKAKIIPCYFPIGRGNPKRAVEILKLLP